MQPRRVKGVWQVWFVARDFPLPLQWSYVCLADGPLLAWNLIGPYCPHIRDWDLWWTNGAAVFPYETIPCDNGDTREYRVYHRVYKRDLWLVGSRVNEHYQPSDLRS